MKRSVLLSLCLLFVTLPVTAASIEVTAPAAAGSWKLNTVKTIQWNFSGIDASATVRIILWKGGDKIGIIANQLPIGANGQGSYAWNVGSVQDAPAAAAGAGYFVKVRTTDDTASGQSGAFTLLKDATTLNSPASQPGSQYHYAKKSPPTLPGASSAQVKRIQVDAPKAGDVLSPTGTYAIHWKFINLPVSEVSLALLRDGEPVATPNGSTRETFQLDWNLGLQPPDPGTYKIAVETLDHAHRGLSGLFTVEEQGWIEPRYPLQGMQLENNSSQEIRWKRVGNIQKLNLALLPLGGGGKQTLAAGADAKLEKLAVVLNPGAAGQYKIEFQYTVGGGCSYVYSEPFTIQVAP